MMTRAQASFLGILAILAAAAAVAFVLSLCVGAVPLPILPSLRALFFESSSDAALILREIRLPRALLGMLVGASLGLSGASMQGLLRNPLAEPGILGVTGGGVFGAVLVLYTGVATIWPLALPAGGMLGAFISVWLLYLLAGKMPSTQTLILAGVALNILAFAGTSLALNLSRNPYATIEIIFWQMGSLADRSLDHVLLAAPFILAGWVLLFWDGQALNALTLGEEAAASMGVPLSHVRFRVIAGTALSVGASVAVCGSIGFVGLVVPHLLRPWVGHEPGKLLSVSALGGAILILLADALVRVLPVMAEVKLGVLTSLIGAPFFIFLIWKWRHQIV